MFAGVKEAYPQTSWSFLGMQVLAPPSPPPAPPADAISAAHPPAGPSLPSSGLQETGIYRTWPALYQVLTSSSLNTPCSTPY